MTAVEFSRLIRNARPRSDRTGWWDGCCPGHDDQRASLSFRDGDRGLILECHAGCPFEKIAAAVGRRPADFFRENGHRPEREQRHIVAVYDYSDAHGALLYQVVRLAPKAFYQRRPDGQGGWVNNMEGVPRVPYRLPELIDCTHVYIPEGEQDVETLRGHGIAATTNEGGAGKWRDEHTRALVKAGVLEVLVIPDNDRPGEAHALGVAQSCLAAGIRVKVVRLPGLPAKGDVTDWIAVGHTIDELRALAEHAPVFEATTTTIAEPTTTEPQLVREGLDLALAWPNGVRFTLAAIRDGRDGVRGELTVTHHARRLSWGAFSLSSTPARETLRKKLKAAAPELPWGEYLERVAYQLTQATREGEPAVDLATCSPSPSRAVMERFLYRSNPTEIHADGDSAKSLFALAVAAAVRTGTALPFGLKPYITGPVDYYDWETDADTHAERLRLLAAGLGIDVPSIVYRRLWQPLVDVAGTLAADAQRRGVVLVIVDSMVFALAGTDGGFHEPICGFYNALRLFAPAATLVLNHITNADARLGGPARPFGGAFATNGPRLIWEMKRDRDVTDATAVTFTNTKANNQPRRFDPFGLRFVAGAGTISVHPFDLTEAAPAALAAAPLAYRICATLGAGPQTLADLTKTLGAKSESVRKAAQRLRDKGKVVLDGDLYRLP
jgi:hypothetical protein